MSTPDFSLICGVKGHQDLRDENAKLRAEVDELIRALELARTFTGLEAEGCPLCTYVEGVFTAACSFHRKLKDLELQNDELKKLITQALPFMRARHEWKPTAPHADMIKALEITVPDKRICEHDWKDTKPSSIRGMQTCAKCIERRIKPKVT